MQKALLQMNQRLPQVVADITGQTGLRIIEAIPAKRKIHDFSEPVQEVWERKAGVDLMLGSFSRLESVFMLPITLVPGNG